MTIDLTTITTPFGLLDAETQATLEAARKAEMRFECYNGFGWVSHDLTPFAYRTTYRLAFGQTWPKARRYVVRYAHLLEEGSSFLSRGKFAGSWGNEGFKIIARARVELTEGQFDD